MQQLTWFNSLEDKKTQEDLCIEKESAYIFEVYYKRVYNYIYYRVNSRHIAEDLTSQVFEKILFKFNTYSESKSPFEVWLFTIVRNVVTDYFRSQKRYRLLPLDIIKEFVSRDKTPESMVVVAETNDQLAQALNILNERERHIIALKFGANLRNKEIAALLDIAESNVGVILYRTMKKLKKEMERKE